MANDSSITQYLNRIYKSEEKSDLSKFTTNMVEEVCAHELGSGKNGLAKVIPTVISLISPVMNTSHQLQDSKGDIYLKKVLAYDDVM